MGVVLTAKVVAPNATILFEGELYEDAATVPDDVLIAISKDDEIYFFYPPVGTIELSKDNSILAVAYYILGLSVDDVNYLSSASALFNANNISTPSLETTVPVTYPLDLESKMLLHLKQESSSEPLVIANRSLRWAAVRPDDGDREYFFVGRSSRVTTNILDLLGRAYDGLKDWDWVNMVDSCHTRDDIEVSEKLEIFGATWRFFGDYTDEEKSIIKNNPDLYKALNSLDFLLFLINSAYGFGAVFGPECTDAALAIHRLEFGSVIVGCITGDLAWDGAYFKYYWDSWKNVLQDFAGCMVDVASLPTIIGTLSWETIMLFIDCVSLSSHILESIVADMERSTLPAYEKLTLSFEIPEMTFEPIPAGAFTMGSPTDELGREDDENQHKVTLTKDFYLQRTEVTQNQWEAVMGYNPSRYSECGDCPVDSVTWEKAQKFISRLNEMEGTDRYRLPTEAEWEYACRAESTTAFANGDITGTGCDDPNLDVMGWYCGNSDQETHPVAQKDPNAWGLYDMHGNACEWCQDRYDEYPNSPATDPTGPSSGFYRVLRGGSVGTALRLAKYCRSASRYKLPPDTLHAQIPHGLRLARDP